MNKIYQLKLACLIACIGGLTGCATPPNRDAETGTTYTEVRINNVPQNSILWSYRISTTPDNRSGFPVYLIKNGQTWIIQPTGNLANDAIELLTVNVNSKIISLGTTIPSGWNQQSKTKACSKSILPGGLSKHKRSSTEYDFCASSLVKINTDAAYATTTLLLAPLLAVTGTASTFYQVDTDQIAQILISNKADLSKLIDAYSAEQSNKIATSTKQAKIAEAQWEKDRPAREKAITARIRAKEIAQTEMLARKKVIGQKICQDIPGTYAPMIGTIMGQPNYDAHPKHTTYFVTAFTERVNGDRINLRVGGVQRLDFNNRLIDADNLSVGA